MIDYGFPHPINQEDRKESAPYIYTIAAVMLITYTLFGVYELSRQKEEKQKREVTTSQTNNIEKIVGGAK